MNCEEVKDRLIFYLDGEVTAGECRLIKQHISGCSDCRQELAALEKAKSSMHRALQGLAQASEPSPQAWDRLQANLARDAHPLPLKTTLRSTGPAPARGHTHPHPALSPRERVNGDNIMRKRIFFIPALAVVVIAVALAFALMRNVTTVSAQQILDRASAAQNGPTASSGIEHVRTETFTNLEGLAGSDAGTRTVIESYLEPQTGVFRVVTRNARTGQVLSASGYDGTYTYTGNPQAAGAQSSVLTIFRYPQNSQKLSDLKRSQQSGGALNNEQVFEQFRSSPHVTVARETWADGRQVYVLRSQQEIKMIQGNQPVHQAGASILVFDASTYQMLESRTTTQMGGQEITVISLRYLANEILPSGTAVAWNLSDLQGVSIVDDPTGEHSDILPESTIQKDLAAQGAKPYVLNFSPAGFEQDITSTPNQPKGQPLAYVVAYRNADGDYFVIQPDDPTGKAPQAFSSRESFQTNAGLVVRFGPETQVPNGKTVISAIATAPDGTQFTITSNLPMDTFKAWANNLIPATG